MLPDQFVQMFKHIDMNIWYLKFVVTLDYLFLFAFWFWILDWREAKIASKAFGLCWLRPVTVTWIVTWRVIVFVMSIECMYVRYSKFKVHRLYFNQLVNDLRPHIHQQTGMYLFHSVFNCQYFTWSVFVSIHYITIVQFNVSHINI